MAIPKTPLLSLGATGTLAGILTHRRHKGITVAETKPIPTDQRTPAQLVQRALFRLGCDWWPAIPEAQRWIYHQMNPQIGANPGFLNFMKEWLMTQVVLHHEQHEDGGADEMDVTGLQGAGGPSWQQYTKIGQYHWTSLQTYSGLTANLVTPANGLWAAPSIIQAAITVDRIGIYIAVGAAGNMRLGIYNDNGATYPGALLLDAGIVDTTAVAFKVITINQALPQGLIWLALLPQAAPTTKAQTYNQLPLLGTVNGRQAYTSYRVVQAYGPLPDPYPAAATPYMSQPHIPLRRSA